MRGDELESPTVGGAAEPAEAPSGETAGTAADGPAAGSSSSSSSSSTTASPDPSAAAAEGVAAEGTIDAAGDGTEATENGSSSAAAVRRTSVNSNDSSGSSRGSGPFALTPPAVIENTSGSSGSRNLLGENGSPKRMPARGIRRKLNRGSKASGKKGKTMMSTTAPARSDVGFAFFAQHDVEDLFVMDEDNVVVEEQRYGDEDEDEDEDDEAPGELVNPLRRQINWAPLPETQTMSQSYAAPAARDWWGGSDDSDSEDEILGGGSGERKERPRVESASSTDGTASEGPSMTGGVFGDRAGPAPAAAPADNFYGSSLPIPIPSMGGRSRKG